MKECLDIFESCYTQEGDHLITDTYVPAPGTYLLVNTKGNVIKKMEIPKAKEFEPLRSEFETFVNKDYTSKLVAMNKPIDKRKVVHSNNLYTFWVKKDSLKPDEKGKTKLTPDIIDGYYALLKQPEEKYKSKKKSLELYKKMEEKLGIPDPGVIEANKKWILDHIFTLLDDLEIEKDKNYLKVFFEASDEVYERESERYLIPNIYNTTEYNQEINSKVIGLPNDNMGMNSKKPFLENKSRKNVIPYLIDTHDVLMQKKFFDFLENQVSMKKTNAYIGRDTSGKPSVSVITDRENQRTSFSGIYLRLKKGMEVEIHDVDQITNYQEEIEPVKMVPIIPVPPTMDPTLDYGQEILRLSDLKEAINQVFFKKFLTTNYFSEPKDIGLKDPKIKEILLQTRRGYFNWFMKGDVQSIKPLFEKSTLALLIHTLALGDNYRSVEQFNLRAAVKTYLKGGKPMNEEQGEMMYEELDQMMQQDLSKKIVDEDLYYFACGQMARYLLNLSKTSQKNYSMVNPILNVKTDQLMRQKLLWLFKKYNYAIIENARFDHLWAMIASSGRGDQAINQEMFLMGYMYANVLYKKTGK